MSRALAEALSRLVRAMGEHLASLGELSENPRALAECERYAKYELSEIPNPK